MPIHVELVTQERRVFEEKEADMVIVPAVEGEMGVLPHHAPVLTTLGIASGAASSITSEIEAQGTNLLEVSPTGGGQGSSLTMADARILGNRDDFPQFAGVAPTYSGNATLVRGANDAGGQVRGVTADVPSVSTVEIADGRFLNAVEETNSARVVVLGHDLAGDLFGGENPIGQPSRDPSPPSPTNIDAQGTGKGFACFHRLHLPPRTTRCEATIMQPMVM